MSDTLITLLAHAVVLLTIPFHECAHGVVSLWQGDPTAKQAHRLTLNPVRHFDLLGFVCLLAVGIGWAKPVPVNPNYYKNRKLGMAVTAAAGPLSNILLGYFFLIVYKFCAYASTAGLGGSALSNTVLVLGLVVEVNLNLAVFNLLPIPPFDGSRIFNLFLPEKLYFQVMKYERYLMLAVLLIFWLGWLDKPFLWLRSGMLNVLDRSSGFADVLAQKLF